MAFAEQLLPLVAAGIHQAEWPFLKLFRTPVVADGQIGNLTRVSARAAGCSRASLAVR
jgi:hypothetical protein